MWRHVAADLAADHTVICPDLRGYGDSDKADTVSCGHFMAEEAPGEVVGALRDLLAR
jgi:pimeloyl-ACP methyl ester carboxylesterase